MEATDRAIAQRIRGARKMAEHGAALAEVRGRIRQRETELAKLRQQCAKIVTDQRATSADELRALLLNLAEHLRSEHVPLARRALTAIVEVVELRGYDITIRYR